MSAATTSLNAPNDSPVPSFVPSSSVAKSTPLVLTFVGVMFFTAVWRRARLTARPAASPATAQRFEPMFM